MTEEEQIAELIDTVKVRPAASPNHGVGLFAIRDIKKGEILHCAIEVPRWYQLSPENIQRLPDAIKELVVGRRPPTLRGAEFISPNHDAIMITFMNHGPTNYDPLTDTATRDIKEGEEIFEDYRIDPDWELAHPWLRDMV